MQHEIVCALCHVVLTSDMVRLSVVTAVEIAMSNTS